MADEQTDLATGDVDAAAAAAASAGDPTPNDADAAAAAAAASAEGDAADAATGGEGGGEQNTDTKVLLSGDGDGEADAEGEGAGIPDAYTYEPPEGVELTDDQKARMTAFGDEAKGMKLSQEQYQALIDYDVKRGEEAATNLTTQFNERVAGWADTTRKDAEIGGDDMPASLGIAKTAQERFATPEFNKLLNLPSPENPEGLGLGNHPEVLRMFYRIGKAMQDSDLVGGDAPGDTESGLKRMYPTMFQATG